MKKPTKKQIADFIKKEFPHIDFDGIKFEESTREKNVYFKVISFGRMIGQADYEFDNNYWERVKNHLKWTFGA